MTIYYQDYPMSGKFFSGEKEITTAEEIETLDFEEAVLSYLEFDPRFKFHITTYASPKELVILEADERRFKAEVSFQKNTQKAIFKSYPQEI